MDIFLCTGNEPEEGCVLVLTVRESSRSEMRTEQSACAASLMSSPATDSSNTDGTSAPKVAYGLEEEVFDRRVRLTVLRAEGLAQVRG